VKKIGIGIGARDKSHYSSFWDDLILSRLETAPTSRGMKGDKG